MVNSKHSQGNPALSAGESQGRPEHKKPAGMSDEELKYRMMLQEAILWVTKQILDEHREEILKRAEDRVKTLQELRG